MSTAKSVAASSAVAATLFGLFWFATKQPKLSKPPVHPIIFNSESSDSTPCIVPFDLIDEELYKHIYCKDGVVLDSRSEKPWSPSRPSKPAPVNSGASTPGRFIECSAIIAGWTYVWPGEAGKCRLASALQTPAYRYRVNEAGEVKREDVR